MPFLHVAMSLSLAAEASPPTPAVCLERTNEMKKATAFDDSGEKFKDQESVQWVLEKFGPYTVGPTEYGDRLAAIVMKLPHIRDKDVEDLLYRVKPCIGMIAQYQALQGLLKSVRHYNLGPEKEKAATQLVLDFIKQRSAAPAIMIEYAIYATLLKQLVDERFVNWDKAKLDALTAIQKQIETAKTRARNNSNSSALPPDSIEGFRKLSAKQKRIWSDQLSAELLQTEQIRKLFRAL